MYSYCTTKHAGQKENLVHRKVLTHADPDSSCYQYESQHILMLSIVSFNYLLNSREHAEILMDYACTFMISIILGTVSRHTKRAA